MCLSVALFSQNAQLFIVTPCCLMSQWLCFDFVVQVYLVAAMAHVVTVLP